MKEDVYKMLQNKTKLHETKDFNKLHPFVKHSCPSFWIQSTEAEYTYHNKKRKVLQYFYLTNENEYMLIYPNFQDVSQKNEVLTDIARQQTYCQYVDKEFNIQEDLD